jgi:RNA polymerase sigma-70 factor (ECF subfamily)
VEDLVHDVFIRIHTNIGTLQDSEKLTSWVYQTARNAVIDFYRKKKSPAAPVTEDLLFTDQEQILDAAEKLTPVVKRMIEELPEKYRSVLVMADIQERKYAEIAAELGLSVSGVKSRVQRARQMLKELLLECCPFEFDRYGTVFGFSERNCKRCCNNGPCAS